MSKENVELVRRIYALLDQGDEAVWDLIPPEAVVNFSRRLMDPMVLPSDEARTFYETQREMWERRHLGWEPKELIDAGDKVLAFILTSGRGKASGAQVEAYVWNLWTFRNGQPVEWTYFGEDKAAALEAAGLEE
jgi:ketosteroid isomerase-like protein